MLDNWKDRAASVDHLCHPNSWTAPKPRIKSESGLISLFPLVGVRTYAVSPTLVMNAVRFSSSFFLSGFSTQPKSVVVSLTLEIICRPNCNRRQISVETECLGRLIGQGQTVDQPQPVVLSPSNWRLKGVDNVKEYTPSSIYHPCRPNSWWQITKEKMAAAASPSSSRNDLICEMTEWKTGWLHTRKSHPL